MPAETITIRRALPTDADALSALAARLFPLGCPATRPEDLAAYICAELTPARFCEYLVDANLVLLVAEVDGAPVGYSMLALRSPQPLAEDAAAAELRKLYVDPAQHGQGVAEALMREALRVVSQGGSRQVWLSCFSENLRAHAFYRRNGFRQVGEVIFMVGDDAQKDFVFLRSTANPA